MPKKRKKERKKEREQVEPLGFDLPGGGLSIIESI